MLHVRKMQNNYYLVCEIMLLFGGFRYNCQHDLDTSQEPTEFHICFNYHAHQIIMYTKLSCSPNYVKMCQ